MNPCPGLVLALIVVFLIGLAAGIACGKDIERTKTAPDLNAFFSALSWVESRHNDNAVGDGGRAKGRYQIWSTYWQDACEKLGVDWDYDKYVTHPAISKAVVLGYFRRYCPKALDARDWQTLARTHNGGPAGMKNPHTLAYWHRVEQAMREGR